MNRTLLFATMLSIAVVSCKNGDKSKTETAETNTANTGIAPKKAPESEPPATPTTATMRAKAPTASDLATYTKGLDGTGTLLARLTTNQGVIHCELFEKGAPLTVANFVGLARGLHPFKDPKTSKVTKRPFYDGLVFHRVIEQFMIQGGDPMGTGQGGPGYKFANEVSKELRHDRPGILSMANAGPNTNGSQFFITETPRPSLDGGYNVFGECSEVDVVGKIARVPKKGSRPIADVVLEKVEIFRGDKSQYPKKPFVQ